MRFSKGVEDQRVARWAWISLGVDIWLLEYFGNNLYVYGLQGIAFAPAPLDTFLFWALGNSEKDAGSIVYSFSRSMTASIAVKHPFNKEMQEISPC